MSRCRLSGQPMAGLGGTCVLSFSTAHRWNARAVAGDGHRIPSGRHHDPEEHIPREPSAEAGAPCGGRGAYGVGGRLPRYCPPHPASGTGAAERAAACAKPSEDSRRRAAHERVERRSSTSVRERLDRTRENPRCRRPLGVCGLSGRVSARAPDHRCDRLHSDRSSCRPPNGPRPRSVASPHVHASLRPTAEPIAGTEAVTLERAE